MKLLIDVNIVLDVLQQREPHVRDSALIWKLCEAEGAEGFVSALTVANLFYVMRKELSEEKIEGILQTLQLIFQVAELKSADLIRAAEMRWKDFEDAVQCATAQRIHADYIITRNIRDFQKSKIPAVTPAEFLTRF